MGKTRVWTRSGVSPPDVEDLGEQVWNPEGIKVLGTPVGTDQFVSDIVAERVQEESTLWEAIEWVPDLQAAWQILVQCAGPRCHRWLRTLPPSQSSEYAILHDVGMLRAMKSLLGGLPGEPQEKKDACRLATLPMRMGGLGLRSATGMAPAAYWASWADALYMVQERLPALSQSIVVQLEAPAEPVGCLSDLRAAGNTLDRHGFVGRPQWAALQEGLRPPPVTDVEPGAGASSVARCVRVVLGRPKSWSDAPPCLSSGLHQICSERSSWRDSVCRCLFVKSGASVDCWSTVKDGTERHASTQAGCALEPQHQNAHSPESAGRPERQFASTRSWWT